MERSLSKARCIIVTLFVTFVTLFLYASSVENEAEGRWGIDYPGRINEYSIKLHPKLFDGFYMRMNNVRLKENKLMEFILTTVTDSNVKKIFGVSWTPTKYYRMYVTEKKTPIEDVHLDPTSNENFPSHINSLLSGYKEVFISCTDCGIVGSKYFFASEGTIIYTDQWINDMFIDEHRYFNHISVSNLRIFDRSIIWQFVICDGEIMNKTVSLHWYYDDYTPIYHFDTDSMEIIRFNPE